MRIYRVINELQNTKSLNASQYVQYLLDRIEEGEKWDDMIKDRNYSSKISYIEKFFENGCISSHKDFDKTVMSKLGEDENGLSKFIALSFSKGQCQQ